MSRGPGVDARLIVLAEWSRRMAAGGGRGELRRVNADTAGERLDEWPAGDCRTQTIQVKRLPAYGTGVFEGSGVTRRPRPGVFRLREHSSGGSARRALMMEIQYSWES